MGLVSGKILVSSAFTMLVLINELIGNLLFDGDEMDFWACKLSVSPFANLAIEQLELVWDW